MNRIDTTAAGDAAGSDARDRILDAAELEFAREGLSGANMRRIADAAQVAPALLHYHFGAKDKLFDTVFGRRAGAINDMRLNALAEMPDPGLEEILYAMFRPALHPETGGMAYLRILSSLAHGGLEMRERVGKLYDPVARVFIDAIRAAEPRLDQRGAARAYQLSMGVLVSSMARTGGADRLLDSKGDVADVAEALGAAAAFAAGGIRALAAEAERI